MNELIDRIRLIDPEAANWLDANRDQLDANAASLLELMTWGETPQDKDFWYRIHTQLEDTSPEAQVARGAAWLDRHYPGWARSAEGANVASHTSDVLCCVTGESCYRAAYKTAGLTSDQSEFLGFSQINPLYQQLWNEAIAEHLHPFTIHSDGSVSYGSDRLDKQRVEQLISMYYVKNLDVGYCGNWKIDIIPSHLRIGCKRFPIGRIEAFIEAYEARSTSRA